MWQRYASSAGMAYVTGASGAAIRARCRMQNPKRYVRFQRPNVPAIIVSVSVQTAKVMKRYLEGEIDGVDVWNSLVRKAWE